MYSQSDIKAIISSFINLISDEFPLSSVYLFGSYAKGNPGEYSDIDIAVVSDKFEGIRFFDKKRLAKYIIKSSVDLEVHPFKTDDFNEENPFAKEIFNTGVRIEIPKSA